MELLLFSLITGILLAIVAGKLDPGMKLWAQIVLIIVWPLALVLMAVVGPRKLEEDTDGDG